MIGRQNRDRIGLKEFELEQLPNNRCRARVVLAWPDGDEFAGAAEAENTQTGRLWCAAEATVRALELSVNHEIALKVVEVRTLLESDTVITVTLLSSRILGEAQQLVGSCIVAEQVGA